MLAEIIHKTGVSYGMRHLIFERRSSNNNRRYMFIIF